MRLFALGPTGGLIGLAIVATPLWSENVRERLDKSTASLQVMRAPGRGVPDDLVKKARCVVVVPRVVTAGLGIGAMYGHGFASCKSQGAGEWSSPAAIRIEGRATTVWHRRSDIVLLVMDELGADKLKSERFVLDSAFVLPGPIDSKSAAASLGVLSYSRREGLFGGFPLDNATLRPDGKENKELYGREVSNADILGGTAQAPASAQGFVTSLNQYTRVP